MILLICYLLSMMCVGLIAANDEVSLPGSASSAPPADTARLVADYFLMKRFRHVMICSCAGTKENVHLHRTLNVVSISTQSLTICSRYHDEVQPTTRGAAAAAARDLDSLHRTMAATKRLGLYIDANCQHIQYILDIFSSTYIPWDGTRAWLMLQKGGAGRGAGASAAASAAASLLAARRLPLALHTDFKLLLTQYGVPVLVDVWRVSRDAPLSAAMHAVYGELVAPAAAAEGVSFELETSVNYTEADVEELLAGAARRAAAGSGRGGGWRQLDTRSRVQRRWRMNYRVNLRVVYCINNKPAGITTKRYLTSRAAAHRDTFTRHSVQLLRHVQPTLQFNWTGLRSKEWGELVNGSWRGALSYLRSGHADLCISPMFIKSHRLAVSEQAGLTSRAELPTLFRQPAVSTASLAQFARPLSAGSWAAAAAVASLAAALAAAVARLQGRYMDAHGLEAGFGTALLEFVNVFYLDGEWGGRALWSGRAGALSACVLGLLLQQFYGASLLGSLLAPPPRPITDLASLLASTLEYKAEDMLYHHLFFQKQIGRPEIARLYREKLSRGPTPPFLPVDEGLERVRQGNFAFQTTASYAYRVARGWEAAARCALDVLHVHAPGPLYTMAAKHSPYTQHLRTVWLRVRTGGVLRYETRRWYGERPRCHGAAGPDLAPVGEQLAPAFYTLAVFGGVSLLVLAAECIAAAAAAAGDRRRRRARGRGRTTHY